MSVKRMKTSHYFPRGRGRGGQDKGPQCCLGRLREGFFILFFLSFFIMERENHAERRVDFALFCFMLKKKIID